MKDPIAELQAELAAEAAAAAKGGDEPAGQSAGGEATDDGAAGDGDTPAGQGDGTEQAGADDAADEGTDEPDDDQGSANDAVAKAAADKAKTDAADKAKKPTRFVPVSRVNEEAAKRRKAENEATALRARLAELEAADEKGADGKPRPVSEKDANRIRSEARQQARLELMAEDFVTVGKEEFGKDFDVVSNTLADLGAPDNLVVIAFEATGGAAAAARAIYALGQLESHEIEAVFKMSPIRLGAKLATLATAKAAKADGAEEDDEDTQPAPKGKQKANGKEAGQQSRAPAPIKPVGGGSKNTGSESDFTDDDSEEEFTRKFAKMEERLAARRH